MRTEKENQTTLLVTAPQLMTMRACGECNRNTADDCHTHTPQRTLSRTLTRKLPRTPPRKLHEDHQSNIKLFCRRMLPNSFRDGFRDGFPDGILAGFFCGLRECRCWLRSVSLNVPNPTTNQIVAQNLNLWDCLACCFLFSDARAWYHVHLRPLSVFCGCASTADVMCKHFSLRKTTFSVRVGLWRGYGLLLKHV